MSEPDRPASPEAVKAGHETAEVPSRPVTTFLILLTVGVVLVFIAMFGLFRLFQGMEDRANPPLPALEAGNSERLPPEPRLQVTPRDNYLADKSEQDSLLATYGWVNRDSALVRIPIERAIRIVADRGLPAREGRTVEPTLRLRPPAVGVEPVPDHGAKPAGGGH